MVPDEVEERWETAYRRYITVWQRTEQSTVDESAARAMAAASSAVATAWREVHAAGMLPWWSASAALTAAEAFEAQAAGWAQHAEELTPPPQPKPVPEIPTVPVDALLTVACPPTAPIPSPYPRRRPLSA